MIRKQEEQNRKENDHNTFLIKDVTGGFGFFDPYMQREITVVLNGPRRKNSRKNSPWYGRSPNAFM